jgi:hypothetical protein
MEDLILLGKGIFFSQSMRSGASLVPHSSRILVKILYMVKHKKKIHLYCLPFILSIATFPEVDIKLRNG